MSDVRSAYALGHEVRSIDQYRLRDLSPSCADFGSRAQGNLREHFLECLSQRHSIRNAAAGKRDGRAGSLTAPRLISPLPFLDATIMADIEVEVLNVGFHCIAYNRRRVSSSVAPMPTGCKPPIARRMIIDTLYPNLRSARA